MTSCLPRDMPGWVVGGEGVETVGDGCGLEIVVEGVEWYMAYCKVVLYSLASGGVGETLATSLIEFA